MNTVKIASRVTTVVAGMGIVALLATGCSRGGDADGSGAVASPGITDTTVSVGISTPLSGPIGGLGTCNAAGLTAYFGGVNAEGGVTFGDGKTRTVEVKALDDTYDPQKAAANFEQLKDEVFIMSAGLGTPTNMAWREAAIAEEVPQVLVLAGDEIFSDPEESPWQLGFGPTYVNQGAQFGEFLVADGQPHKIAVLSQNDDAGAGYVRGLKEAIADSSDIEIVKELTYEASDTSVDAQITELAGTGADVFFDATLVPPLAVSALQKVQQLGWDPIWFLPQNAASPTTVLNPGGASAYQGVYTASFAKTAADPAFSGDADVQKFLSDLSEYADYPEVPAFPTCEWSYMIGSILEQAFEKTTEPTRENFMDALHSISDFQTPLMPEGVVVDTTVPGQSPISTGIIRKFNGEGFDTVTTLSE